MNIIFFGSSDFAVPSLQALIASAHKISCVVTQPDRRKGRGLHLEGTSVKVIAQRNGLKIYQPQRINSPEVLKLLKNLNPDLLVVIAYGQILSQDILDIAKGLAINVHGSLLPQYRGAAPINWAIIKGETATGVTIIKMVKEMDAGPILLHSTIGIQEHDTFITLEDKLSKLAAPLLMEALVSVENNNYKLIEQDERKISLAPKLKKTNGNIDWDAAAKDIHNLVRGFLPWPGAFTYYKGKLLKIYQTKIEAPERQGARASGEILNVSQEGIVVATGKDDLVIEELQIEGRRKMMAEEFIAGHKIRSGERLEKK